MADEAGTGADAKLDELPAMLKSAREGGLKLDTVLAYAVASADLRTETLRDVMTEGSFSWEVASELLDDRLPPFTRPLDAALPGENIVLATYSDKRGQWAAVQRETDGREFMSWTATEALARRTAALEAFVERMNPSVADEIVPVAALVNDKSPVELQGVETEAAQPVATEAVSVEPASNEPVVEKIMREARPDAPEWRIKF